MRELGPTDFNTACMMRELGPTDFNTACMMRELGPTDFNTACMMRELGPTDFNTACMMRELGPTDLIQHAFRMRYRPVMLETGRGQDKLVQGYLSTITQLPTPPPIYLYLLA